MLPTLETYLAGILSPMHRAKAEAALEMMVRLNGATTLLPRHKVIEDRIREGAEVINRKGETVLMNREGAWLDQRNITKHGLDYAVWLSTRCNPANLSRESRRVLDE